jgi:hypothetical protein
LLSLSFIAVPITRICGKANRGVSLSFAAFAFRSKL